MNQKQTVVITGASSGIGAATAELFAKNNFNLVLLGRNPERLQKVQKKCLEISTKPIEVRNHICDLRNLSESAFLDDIVNMPEPSILVNNAGIYSQKSFALESLDYWREQFEVNLLGSVRITQILWRLFQKNNFGSIVNVSSTLGLKPIPNTSAYSAMKAAMINWTFCLAQEGGSNNIRANVVCPGIVDTPLQNFHNLEPIKKTEVEKAIYSLQLLPSLGHVDQIAESIFFLATEKSKWTTGTVLSVDGGINLK